MRVTATVLTAAALLCWARAGAGLLCAGMSLLLAVLAIEINSGWMMALDSSVERWIAPYRSTSLRLFLADVYGAIGEPVYFAAVVVVSGLLISLRRRQVVPAVLLVSAVGFGVAVKTFLKATVDPGFPSGHVTAIGVFFGTVAVCLAAGQGHFVKFQVWILATAGVGVIAIMALYTRAHTVTEVLGGMVLGGAVVALGAAVLARTNPTRRLPRPDGRPITEPRVAALAPVTS